MDNKSLISQYVNLGLRLPEHQVNQLSVNDLNSYLRMRIIGIGVGDYYELLFYEYKKMSDNQKDNFIKNLKNFSVEDAMMTLNWRGKSDEFVSRLIRIRPCSDITDNVIHIIRNSHSVVSVIYEILNVCGPIFNYNHTMSILLHDCFFSSDAKLKFSMEYLKLLSDNINQKMSIINSPITSMLGNLDSIFCKSLSKYFIILNLGKKNGNKIDGDTFITLFNNASDSTFEELSAFMKESLDLSPNQLDYIEKEREWIIKI